MFTPEIAVAAAQGPLVTIGATGLNPSWLHANAVFGTANSVTMEATTIKLRIQ